MKLLDQKMDPREDYYKQLPTFTYPLVPRSFFLFPRRRLFQDCSQSLVLCIVVVVCRGGHSLSCCQGTVRMEYGIKEDDVFHVLSHYRGGEGMEGVYVLRPLVAIYTSI